MSKWSEKSSRLHANDAVGTLDPSSLSRMCLAPNFAVDALVWRSCSDGSSCGKRCHDPNCSRISCCARHTESFQSGAYALKQLPKAARGNLATRGDVIIGLLSTQNSPREKRQLHTAYHNRVALPFTADLLFLPVHQLGDWIQSSCDGLITQRTTRLRFFSRRPSRTNIRLLEPNAAWLPTVFVSPPDQRLEPSTVGLLPSRIDRKKDVMVNP